MKQEWEAKSGKRQKRTAWLCCAVAQSCLALRNPMDCSPPGSSTGTLQARMLEWVAISSSSGSSPPRDQTRISYNAGRFFTVWATREAIYSGVGCCFLPQGNLPNPGITTRFPTLHPDSLPSEPPGKPKNTGVGSLSLLQGIFPTQEQGKKKQNKRLSERHIKYETKRCFTKQIFFFFKPKDEVYIFLIIKCEPAVSGFQIWWA